MSNPTGKEVKALEQEKAAIAARYVAMVKTAQAGLVLPLPEHLETFAARYLQLLVDKEWRFVNRSSVGVNKSLSDLPTDSQVFVTKKVTRSVSGWGSYDGGNDFATHLTAWKGEELWEWGLANGFDREDIKFVIKGRGDAHNPTGDTARH